MQLSYYLFESSVKSFKDVWQNNDPQKAPKDFKPVKLKKSFAEFTEAYLQKNNTSVPQWVEFVRPCCAAGALDGIRNTTNSFVILLKAQKRIFAVCFGYGYTAIDQELIEPDFGLWVAANSIASNKVVAVQARNVDPITVSKHFVVNRDSEMFIFDIDFMLNVLTSLDGRPEDSKFGTRVRGRDACYLTAKVDVGKLKSECSKLLKAYGVTRKDDAFQMLRDVRYVKQKALQQKLNQKLSDALRAGEDTALGLVLPDIGEYEQITKYVFGTHAKAIEMEELAIEKVLQWIEAHRATSGSVLSLKFEALNDDGAVLRKFTLKQAVVFQAQQDGDTFVHTLGRWYRVAADFVQRVNDQLASGLIKTITKRNWLPDIHEVGQNAEGRYNERASNKTTRALLDKDNVHIPGESQIEVADLFSKDKEFIHVKRHTRSATLSHLFAQGTVSGRLFREYEAFRKKLRTKLPTKLKSLIDPKSASVSGYTVVYAISAPAHYTLPDDLPFFSKVNLLQHSRELDRMGYGVKLYHIRETEVE